MASVVLCSASGAPGVTTTALGLTLCWPRDVLLLDADRTPAQAVLAGYLRGTGPADGGLPAILQAHRERRPIAESLVSAAMLLPEPFTQPGQHLQAAEGPVRRFVSGFMNLGSIDVFGGAWHDLGAACQSAPFDVVVDGGRIGSRGLPSDFVETVDRVLVVVRTTLPALAALRLYLALVLDQVPSERVGLLLVGPGRPYRAPEVAEQFGVPVSGEIPWDPEAAGELHEGVQLAKRWRSQSLAKSYTKVAANLVASLAAERQRIGVAT